MSIEKEPCKPGGCPKMGCDGGHYCFNADGTPKVMSEEKKTELDNALQEIFRAKGIGAVSPPGERRKKLPPYRQEAVNRVRTKYLAALDKAEVRRDRRIRRSKWLLKWTMNLFIGGVVSYFVIVPMVKYLTVLLGK